MNRRLRLPPLARRLLGALGFTLLLAVTAFGGFIAGQLECDDYWRGGSPAQRTEAGAYEGSLAQRLERAQRARDLDPAYLGGYLAAGRAYLEESTSREEAERGIAVLTAGLVNCGFTDCLEALAGLHEQAGRSDEARRLRALARDLDPRPAGAAGGSPQPVAQDQGPRQAFCDPVPSPALLLRPAYSP